jgi:Protein of unknown function (DUF3102)
MRLQARRACDGSNSLADLAARIRAKHEAVGHALRRGLEDMIAAGDLLLEAKRQLNKHGSWLPWLKEHCQIPERTAQLCMRLARLPPEIRNVADLTVRDAIELLTEAVGAPAQVEMPFPPKVGALTPPTIRTRCADCNIGTITLGESYVVQDDVWQQAWVGRLKEWHDAPGQQILCIHCLEQRLGRKLNRDDFADAKVNKPAHPNISPRLAARLQARGNERH